MNQIVGRLAAAGLASLLLTAAYTRHNSVGVMTQAAQAFIASLNEEQKAKACFDFHAEDRFFWHYIPSDDIPKRYNHPRMGLMIAEMQPHQRHLASALLSAGLSQSGYIKATTIMSLEDVLRVMENDTRGRRNPEKYHFSIFGRPDDRGTWSYRVEGHHVSLHFTIVNGKLAGSPTFLGANPHEVRQGPRSGLRVLAREEDLGRGLLMALTPAQRKVAVLSDTAYKDILTQASRKAALEGQPSGLQASSMTEAQRKMLRELIEEYIYNMPEPIARHRLGLLQQAGNRIHFAWAGPAGKGEPHYYRVMAPTFLIEYDNTQNRANHSHTVWREFSGDFGEDLLKSHYQNSH